MVRLMEVHNLEEDQARAIAVTQLPMLMAKLVRQAHRRGAKGREAYAEHSFEGPLLDASIRLRDEFEDRVRECVSEAWSVGFGYTVINHAPGTVILRLK
jgi:hypothetical protein